MAAFLSKYGVARHIYIPIIKRAVVDYAVGADWTPAAGDVKISKDGGAAANVGTLPVAIAMGNGAMWDFTISATEMQAAQVTVTVVDAATKAVEDQAFVIETYGNASAQHEFDLDTPTVVASSVSALAANVITAASINADAITAAKIADNAIDRATFAADTGLQSVRSNTAQAGAAGTITLDAAASATTDFYKGLEIYLTGATGVGQARIITAYNGGTKVATISPNWATNPDVTTTFAIIPQGPADVEMTAAVLTFNLTGNITGNLSGSVGSVTGAVGSVTGAVGSVTGNVGGNVTGSVGSIATGGIVAASFAASAITATVIATGAITNAKFAAGAIDAAAIATDAIGAAELATDAVTEIAGAVWDVAIASHLTAGTTGLALNSAGSAGDPWNTALPGAYAAGTAGKILGTNLDATVSSRLATAGYTVPPTANANADALLDRANAVETGLTLRQALRGFSSVLFGKWSGRGTATKTFRDAIVDSKNRIVATTDATGRSAVTPDFT